MSIYNTIATYQKAFSEHPLDAARSFLARLRSENPLEKLPYMCWGAIDLLRREVGEGTKVFEYGSGGSTVFLAGLGAELVSVEHDAQWYGLIQKRLVDLDLNRVDHRFVPPVYPASWGDLGRGDVYGSGMERYVGMDFRDYVEVINEFPDSYFDVLIIDGRARVKCAQVGLAKVRNGGLLLLDDSRRARYGEIRRLLEKQVYRHFTGIHPYPKRYSGFICDTTVWKVSKSGGDDTAAHG